MMCVCSWQLSLMFQTHLSFIDWHLVTYSYTHPPTHKHIHTLFLWCLYGSVSHHPSYEICLPSSTSCSYSVFFPNIGVIVVFKTSHIICNQKGLMYPDFYPFQCIAESFTVWHASNKCFIPKFCVLTETSLPQTQGSGLYTGQPSQVQSLPIGQSCRPSLPQHHAHVSGGTHQVNFFS